MVAGRPLKHTDKEIEAIGEEMLSWFKGHSDAISLQEWLVTTEYDYNDTVLFRKQSAKFLKAFNKCKGLIKVNRDKLARNSKLPMPMWAKSDHVYDHYMVETDEDAKDREHERKKAEDILPPNSEGLLKLFTMAQQMEELQKKNADLQRQLDERGP